MALAWLAMWFLVLCEVDRLAGCTAPAPELRPEERAAVHAALAGWADAGLPPVDAERCDFGRVIVRVARDADDFERLCHALASQHDGCTLFDSSAHFFRPKLYPVAVIDPTFPREYWGALIVHETCHAMYRCSGMAYWSPANTQHLDRRVWTRAYAPGEDAGSAAESRANALLGR